ncbi:hypothetical protein BGW80DRAFT_934323 [Lactifluus volemus]|nr:hypothetical protein BGW80DRAFT_934323 [Lactifluus volemus]
MLSLSTSSGRPGLLSSPPRIFMLAMTTLMFILGLIGFVSITALKIQDMYCILLSPSSDGIRCITELSITASIVLPITFVMVGSVNHGRSAADTHN